MTTGHPCKDCFYAFYKLGNAPKSVSAGVSPRTPLGKLTALPLPLAGGEGARRVLPKNPTSSSALRALTIQAMLCPPPTPPKINPSYGLVPHRLREGNGKETVREKCGERRWKNGGKDKGERQSGKRRKKAGNKKGKNAKK